MKKAIALMLVLVFCSAWMCALADDLDLSYVREKSNLYVMDVDSDREIAFITTHLNAEQRSFEHEYNHPTYYSYTEADILVTDYFSASPKSIFRWWIDYAGTKALYINSVSFIINDREYTFSDLSDKERRVSDENGYEEKLLIKFGETNFDFFSAVTDNFDFQNTTSIYPIKMVLHGCEDVSIELSDVAIADLIIIGDAFIEINHGSSDSPSSTTPMKITDL